MDLMTLTAAELAEHIRKKEISSLEITRAYLDAAKRENPRINGYITICEESALAEADAADRALASGASPGPLHGVPLALKDNLSTRGIRTTCASRMLENYVPVFDATVVLRLRAAGAVVLGKTNMDEFAMGSTTEHSFFGPTRNPVDPERVPGGSSGGSAAVVAARMAPCALGSDTGGSIRQPAACCGVTGLKPTYGRVSRYGLVAFASSLDQIGPLTRDVRDAGLLLNVIGGSDDRDATSSPEPLADCLMGLDHGVRGLRIGLPREYFGEGLDPEMKTRVMEAARALEKEGASLVEVTLPRTEYGVAAYYILATAEAGSNLARYDGVKYGLRQGDASDLRDMYRETRSAGFGAEVKRRIMLGNYVLSSGYYDAYYRKAQKVRKLIQQDFEAAFAACDALIGPAMPHPPFRLGEKSGDPLALYLSDIYTISANLAGIPGLTLPFGKAGGLPAGVQLMGRGFSEATLLRIGRVLEQRGRAV